MESKILNSKRVIWRLSEKGLDDIVLDNVLMVASPTKTQSSNFLIKKTLIC